MSEDEQLKLLATDGMLVKRPLVIGDGVVLTGFKEKEWEDKINGERNYKGYIFPGAELRTGDRG